MISRLVLCSILAPLLFLTLSPLAFGQDSAHAALKSPHGTYDDNGVPFFGQTLDARKLGPDWPSDNLTPRGIILDLGYGYHACFDQDLLRLSLLWQEEGRSNYLSMNGMAPGSYRQPNRKSPSGQNKLPVPIGSPILANGLYPGVHLGDTVVRQDPRSPGLDANEVGRGPLPGTKTRWLGLRLEGQHELKAVLCYQFAGTRIEERWEIFDLAEGAPMVLIRSFRIAPHEKAFTFALSSEHSFTAPPSQKTMSWSVQTSLGKSFHQSPPASRVATTAEPKKGVPRIWKDEVKVPTLPAAPNTGSFVFEDLPLPLPNPWKRNVRPSDFDFFPDGRLALCTFDGDVWIADGIEQGRESISWSRFASGLHESMGLRIENGTIVISDRNGLTRLIDRDGNGEADYFESLSTLAAQTAETREFAMSFELKPGGGYYLSKGGQVATSRGKYNGDILEIAADGSQLKVVATGLRQPFLGLDPKTGLLTSSDQQGHWVPATPLHVIRPGDYYGFQPTILGANANEGKEIAEPPLWIPHFVNQSAARQVWLRKANMGALNDCLIHVGYNRPALFKIYLDQETRQGAIVPLLQGFPTGLLNGRVNPVDGLLYVGGLNIWGTVGKKIQGLYRIRPTGNPTTIPREIHAFREGIFLKFDQELDHDQATDLANYTVDRWNYKRSNQYGSGHYKLDGSPGQESLAVSCIYISEDHQSVFLGIPGMTPVDSLRVTFQVKPKVVQNAYLTIRTLPAINLTNLGFEETEVDLNPVALTEGAKRPEPTAELGLKIATTYGCIACHSTDGSKKVAEDPNLTVGPGWKGLYGSKRNFTDGTYVSKADEVYLRESILDPSANVTKGFETSRTGVGMPSYLGVLRDDQIESIILYLKSLK